LRGEPGTLAALLAEARACRACAAHLEPRPILRLHAKARILIVGQAPGVRAHETRTPWNDASGDRLRLWLGLDRETFYDETRIAIMPMGFCYPGRAPDGGDLPPRPECAPLWHRRLGALLTGIEMTLLVGGYAHAFYLGPRREASMGATVRAWRRFHPFVPLPHPSWRNNAWLARNEWFAAELLPALRRRVSELAGAPRQPARARASASASASSSRRSMSASLKPK
jgi:uracil-DNA glycosylase